MNCWISTADVSPALWVCIALAIPVVIILFIMHRKEKFTCCGKYNPVGLENRLAWLSTFALAIFFYIKMFVGPAYLTTIFNDTEQKLGLKNARPHALCAIITLTLRLILSIVQASSFFKNGNWKTTIPFAELYN